MGLKIVGLSRLTNMRLEAFRPKPMFFTFMPGLDYSFFVAALLQTHFCPGVELGLWSPTYKLSQSPGLGEFVHSTQQWFVTAGT